MFVCPRLCAYLIDLYGVEAGLPLPAQLPYVSLPYMDSEILWSTLSLDDLVRPLRGLSIAMLSGAIKRLPVQGCLVVHLRSHTKTGDRLVFHIWEHLLFLHSTGSQIINGHSPRQDKITAE